MPLIPDLDVDNVFVYVGDAVRWDFLPDHLLKNGFAVKSVSASIHTPASFASIVSGTYPPHHRVGSFSNRLPEDVPNILQNQAVETKFSNTINHARFDKNESEDLITDTINVSNSSPNELESIEPPFVFIERGPGGHSPYGDYTGTSWEYYEERGSGPTEQYVKEYQDSIKEDIEWFQERVETISQRGLKEDTLIIYTGDHGEMLGERGMVAHSPPIHPTHVYVPTVFFHPDLQSGVIRQQPVSHTDLVPTISSLLGLTFDANIEPVGRDLTQSSPANQVFSFYEQRQSIKGQDISLEYDSIWNSRGGYVFPRSSKLTRAAVGVKRVLKGPWRNYIRSHLFDHGTHLLEGKQRYGAPDFSTENAEEFIRSIKEEPETDETNRSVEVDNEHLRNLGYME